MSCRYVNLQGSWAAGHEQIQIYKRYRQSQAAQDTQYAFRSCSGQYLSVSDRAPFVTLAGAPRYKKSKQNHRQ